TLDDIAFRIQDPSLFLRYGAAPVVEGHLRQWDTRIPHRAQHHAHIQLGGLAGADQTAAGGKAGALDTKAANPVLITSHLQGAGPEVQTQGTRTFPSRRVDVLTQEFQVGAYGPRRSTGPVFARIHRGGVDVD